jgi:hypothetical protein
MNTYMPLLLYMYMAAQWKQQHAAEAGKEHKERRAQLLLYNMGVPIVAGIDSEKKENDGAGPQRQLVLVGQSGK